jgi:hypothetical protein
VGKRNLWKLLTGADRATAAELAAEVVELEGRLPALRAEVADAHEAAVGAAQKRLAGAGPATGKDAPDGEAAARLMLEAAERTLDDLRGKLTAAVEAERAAELAPIEAELRALEAEKAEAVGEVRRCVVALAVACYHLEPYRHGDRGVSEKLFARTPLIDLMPFACATPGKNTGFDGSVAKLPAELLEGVEREIERRGLVEPASTIYARTGEARKRLKALTATGTEERVAAALAAARNSGG